MLTPEKIKKATEALEICHDLITFDPATGEDIDPMFLNEDNRDLYYGIETILQYIQQLERDVSFYKNIAALNDKTIDEQNFLIEEIKAERDAAVKDMYEAQSIVCLICKNHYQPDPAVKKYGCKAFGEYYPEDGAIVCGKFEWRGVQKEE